MRKLIAIGLLAITLITTLIACSHSHSFAEAWNNNEDGHWHVCSCGEKSELAEHVWDNGKVTVEATEETAGNKQYACVDCGYTKNQSIPALAHTHKEEKIPAVAPTCTTDGLTEGKKCSKCNEILVAQTKVPATGHTEVTVPGYAATCTVDGLTDGKKCSTCQTTLTAQTVIPATGHSYGEVTYTWGEDNLTCTATRVCANDATHVETETVNSVHTHEDAEEGKDGYDNYVATFTNTAFVEQVKNIVIPALDHVHHYEKEVIAPTCTEKGYTIYTCRCEDTYNDDYVDENGHTEETVAGKAATCTEDGLTEGKKCSVCHETLVAQETIEAEGHTEETVAGKAATCTEKGLTDGKKCSVCHETLVAQEEISTVAHTEEVVPGKAATCTETGLTDGKKCSVCHETLVAQEEIPTVAHTEEVVPGKAATCTEDGLTDGKKCSVCQETLVAQETIKATGHSYTSATTDPTCTEAGYTTYTCTCGDTYTEAGEAAKGHDLSLTYTHEEHYYACSRCDYTEDHEAHTGVNKLEVKEEKLYNTVVCDCGYNASVEVTATSVEVTTFEDLKVAVEFGINVTVTSNIVTECNIVVTKDLTLTVNEGVSILATNDKDGDGVFQVKKGTLTIEGNGTISGTGDNKYNMAIWANGGHVVINGCTFTNVGAKDPANPDDDHFDLIYVKAGGTVTINGGTFIAQNPKWTLNSSDSPKGTIIVKGGKFYGYDPAKSSTEPGGFVSFVHEEYHSVLVGENYEVYPHNYTAVETKVTCTTDGYTTYTCSCEHSYVVAGEKAKGHTETTLTGYAATCTENGLTDGKHCTACNTDTVVQEVIEATGHVEGELIADSATHWTSCTNCTSKLNEASHVYGELYIENQDNSVSQNQDCECGYTHVVVAIQGAGTENNPYLISNENELVFVNTLIAADETSFEGKYVKLTSNIALTNGEFTIALFAGVFDGNEKEVSELNINGTANNVGFIGKLTTTGVVKNLTIKGKVTSTAEYVGGVVGYSYGEIINCTNYANVTGAARVGGIVGKTVNSVFNCTNYGTITSNGEYAGGIAGAFGEDYQSELVIKNCTNEGTITADSNRTGGITGYSYWNVAECTNKGNITGKNDTAGIAGYVKVGYVSQCTNEGTVNGNTKVGGIVGDMWAVTVKNCNNTANITGVTQTGGIVGLSRGKEGSISTIDNCTNSGLVTANYLAGGIVALNEFGVILNCSNSGDVCGVKANQDFLLGGICGRSATSVTYTGTFTFKVYKESSYVMTGTELVTKEITATIINCSNTGKVYANCDTTTTHRKIGGIVGEFNLDKDSNTYTGTIAVCYNSGEIIGSANTGGIIGLAGSETPQPGMKYCYQLGVTVKNLNGTAAKNRYNTGTSTTYGLLVGKCSSKEVMILTSSAEGYCTYVKELIAE